MIMMSERTVPLQSFEPFRSLPKIAQWGVLMAISVVMVALLKLVRLPAALLLGPMIAGILLEVGGGKVRVPRVPYHFALAVIGCMVAKAINKEILASFAHQWPVLLGAVLAVILLSCLLGVIISKLGLLPDTTAIWGLLPGAASVMMVMAESFGADVRLVAFMQYLRVVCVAIVASLIARFWVHASGSAAPTLWFPEIHWLAFGETLALVLFGMIVGHRSRSPMGVLQVPMLVGSVLHVAGVIELELPPWLLACSFLLLGWNIGLRFSRNILLHALRLLPQTLLSVMILIAFCGLVGFALVHLLGIDPLSAYLATSPGGIDSAAVIAASTKVDMPFVMAQQTVRFLLVLMIGPSLSRWVARRIQPAANSA
jgi:membrane AbrB-like protein